MSTNDVGPPQSSVPAPDTATAPAPAPGVNQPPPSTNQQPQAPAPGANPPAPFSAGQFPIFVGLLPPLTEITDAVPSPSSTASSSAPAGHASNATAPIIDYHLYITDCHYGCTAAYSFSAVIAIIIMSAVAFIVLHVTRKRREHAEDQLQQIQVYSVAESDPSVLKYQPPLTQRYDGVSKPNEFKRRSDFGTPQDYNEYDLRKPNPYASQPPPVPYGVAGVAPGGMGYLYGEQGRASEDMTEITDEEYMNMDTPHYGGVGGFASMLPPPPPPPTHVSPPGESPVSPEFHHERDSDFSMPFSQPHQAVQDDQHLHALHPDHPGDSPISSTGAHFNIGPPRPAPPPPPSQPPEIIAPRAQFHPITLPLPPISTPPIRQEMHPQQPQFMEVVPDEYEGYFVEGEEYEFHPQQYDEDSHEWFADGGEDLDVGQYYAPHQSFEPSKK